MTTVTDFASYYLRRLWREGDQDLINDLPQLVKEAEARMSRDIREHSLATTVKLVAEPGVDYFTIPVDFSELIGFNLSDGRPSRLVSMDELYRIRSVTPQGRADVYAVQGNKIYFAAPFNPAFVSAPLSYYMKVPPAPMEQPAAQMGFYDLHPDYFLSALDVQSYTYLREYELSSEKNAIYGSLLETMIRNSNYARWPSGQLDPWASEPRGKRDSFVQTSTVPVDPDEPDYADLFYGALS